MCFCIFAEEGRIKRMLSVAKKNVLSNNRALLTNFLFPGQQYNIPIVLDCLLRSGKKRGR